MNTIGRLFKVSIYGESHGASIGIILDGVPAGIALDSSDFIADLSRRKPGKAGTTARVEDDLVLLESGVFNGHTTGSPILVRILNKNQNSKDYSNLLTHPRPSHADFVSNIKYNGFQDYRGGGHFSGRLTTALVAAGVVAKKIHNIDIQSEIINLGGETDKSKYNDIVNKAVTNLDSVGGIIRVTAKNADIGLGEPYFDSVESVLSHLLFSVGGIKGVQFGTGFNGVNMFGSEFNDKIIDAIGTTSTNNNGGINGGITNGNDIVVDVFVKPTPSIYKAQDTFSFITNEVTPLEIVGRHDAAIILRAGVVLEAMVAIGLADLSLVGKAYKE